MFFSRDEYRARWRKVDAAMAARGYENAIVWQRSAGTYDKLGDVYWLTNFYTFGTGQDPASDEFGAPYTFSAVLLRRGHEPELHIGLPTDEIEAANIACGELISHAERHIVTGLADHFRAQGIAGPIAVVGDDILPASYDRLLRKQTPQIEWRVDETLLVEPQLIKSPRELDAFRAAGEIITAALTAATEAMIAGEPQSEAAARAAGVILRAGGGFHRIDISHGPKSERFILSRDLYGYNTKRAAAGDLVTVWIYGPIFEGYWLDPGRTAICANRPTSAQKALLEGTVEIVDALIAAIVPGTTARAVGVRGAEVARKVGFFDSPQECFPLFGHGLGACFPPYLIPVGDIDVGPIGLKTLDQPIEPGMVLAAEAFLTHPGVGTAGYERNFIVTTAGAEILDKTPMLF